MSTGGGWQDQVGGLTNGVKLVTTKPGLKQNIRVQHLNIPEAAIQELRDTVIDGLMAIRPDLDRADLERRMAKENSQYEVLLTGLEEEEAQAIRDFIEENDTGYYLYLTPSTKRYYPFGDLASQVLGFVNSEGGAYGLEAKYEEILKGIPGRVVTGRTAENDELYNSYSNYVDAVNGYNLTLTIDSTIQSYAE